MNASDWISGGAAVLAAALGSGGALSVWLKRREHLKRARRGDRTLVALEDVAEAFSPDGEHVVLVGIDGAVRVLLLRTENGGGIPGPERQVYSSAIHEVHAKGTEPVRERWQRIPVDESYAALIGQVVREGKVNLVTDEMPAGSLRDLYEAHGIARAYVRAISADEGGFTYLSINCSTPGEKSATERERMRGGVAQLRRILGKRAPSGRIWPQ